MQMLDEEEEGKGRVQALTEEPRSERREERCPTHREERCSRRSPCAGAVEKKDTGYVTANCAIVQTGGAPRMSRSCGGEKG